MTSSQSTRRVERTVSAAVPRPRAAWPIARESVGLLVRLRTTMAVGAFVGFVFAVALAEP